MTRSSLLLLALLTAVPACRSMPDVLEAHQAREGTSSTYEIAAPAALDLAAKVLRQDGADAIELHPEAGYLLATYGIDGSSYGTLVGVWVTHAGASRSEVTVVTKRSYAMGMFTRLTESTFHEEFQGGLTRIQTSAAR